MNDLNLPPSPGAKEETGRAIEGWFMVLAAVCVGMAWGACLALSMAPVPIVTECPAPQGNPNR